MRGTDEAGGDVLLLHRAATAPRLVAALVAVVAGSTSDPFAPVVVAVPAKGIERWLSQRLSHELGAKDGDGVCANVEFPSPAQLLDAALACASPEMAVATKAWPPAATTWALLDLLDTLESAGPMTAPVRHFLGDSTSSSRRYALASKVAGLFSTYAAERPELLRSWSHGDIQVPEDLRWEADLWLRLRDQRGPGPAELHDTACQGLRDHPERSDLPDTLSVYGLTRLSKARLDALAALAEHRYVHLFVHHPGPSLWNAITTPVVKRADDHFGLNVQHPLLASLSQDVRELQQRLFTTAPDLITRLHDAPIEERDLLHQLQVDLTQDRVPTKRKELLTADRSIQVHACHGPARQVEVLREALLGILERDTTLEPRDVLILCPDVETYAPLITAVFKTDAHPGGRLNIAIADRSPRQTNPLLGLAARLLELASGRVTGAQVLDLAGSPAVRQRFLLTDDDLEQLRAWTVTSRVHWGLDAEARKPWGIEGLAHGTWRVGLDRVLAGVALGDLEHAWGETLPMGGLDSGDVELVGRLAELVDRLDAALTALTGRQTVQDWLATLEHAVDALGGIPWDGEWQRSHLSREIADVTAAATGSTALLSLADATALLDERLAGRPTRSSFRTGAMTICTLTPMRSVPHRVVCLIGMDDGAFPRHGIPDGDDLLGRDPHVGERDPRSEDRQLFLDTLLAAQEHLVVTYTGADVRSGAALPPAVPVSELLDALDLTAVTQDGKPAREQVVVHHPLQPFDPRNFTDDELGTRGAFSFDRAAYAGAVALVSDRTPSVGLVAEALGDLGEMYVELQRLTEFFEHPAKAFLQQRLGVFATSREEEPEDAIPLQLDNLEQWAIGDRALRARLAGQNPAAFTTTERARGQLPPGHLGDELLAVISPRVAHLAAAAQPHLLETPATVDIDVELPSAVRLIGEVRDVRGEVLVTVTYSTLKPKQRIRAWLQLLALTAAHPERPWSAILIGRAPRERVATIVLPPVSVLEAPLRLDQLVDLRTLGLRTPAPLPVTAAAAYAEGIRVGTAIKAREAAAEEWTSGYGFPRDDADPENVLLWGQSAPFATLWDWISPLPLPGAGYATEPSQFAVLARRVWADVLEHEQTTWS